MAEPKRPILEIQNITKTFGATKALTDVSLTILEGEVHAIVGSNGAGKSTLMKLLSGLYPPDSGAIVYAGRDIAGRPPLEMQRMGIQTVHQALNIVGSMTVLENILLAKPPLKRGFLRWQDGKPDVVKALEQIDFPLDLRMTAERLSVSQQQFVILARAIINGAKVLILDEPTARLGLEETNKLFALIRRLKQQGTTILYISHRMEEIFTISDRISIFRDGRLVCTENAGELSEEALVSAMLGKKLDAFFPKVKADIGEDILQIGDLHCMNRVHGVSMRVRSGEIVALVPEDRAGQGMIGEYAVRENISSVDMRKISRRGALNRRLEDRLAEEMVAALDVRPADIRYLMTALSGGNQQKVVVGKWLTGDYTLYLMDEVTSGVDIQAKASLYTIMGEIVQKGGAVLLCTGDIEEALGIADRIIVLFKGRIIHETAPEATTKDELLSYIMGGGADA